MPTRQVYWNIDHVWVMYVLLLIACAIGGYGLWRRLQRWLRVARTHWDPGQWRFDRVGQRMRRVAVRAIVQRPIWRRPLSGFFHSLLFWGMLTLLAATTVVMLHHDFRLPIMQGRFYLYFQSFFVDVMGGLALVAIVIAGLHRWVWKPKRLVQSNEATAILVMLGLILATGFMLEGWRIEVTNDPWGAWSPIGYVTGKFTALFMSDDAMRLAHRVGWWTHMAMAFGVLAWAPYTKLIHPLTSTLNIFFTELDDPAGALPTIDFESAETFGVNRLDQFSGKDLLDLDACTECGRCTDACPANTVGKRLSPRDLILQMRDQPNASAREPRDDPSPHDEGNHNEIRFVDALDPEALFQCTTCAACVEACPVDIKQYPKIVQLRRYQVMEEAEYPRQMQEAINSLEQRGHPFRGTQASRTDWIAGLDVPHYDDVEDPEVLLWVGCGGALVDRNQSTTRALARLLQYAGVRFGVLGKDESCTGDPARRIGNEFLFDTLARKNIDKLQSHHVHTIVTPCPHCFNSFRRDYPQLGAKLRVIHHTTFLAQLIGEGRISGTALNDSSVTFHDPCYLSRHNEITDEPRNVLAHATGTANVEMPRHGKQSFCCGGGGGRSFVDEPADQRVNVERAKEAVASGASTVAVACPFCTTMLEDGIGAVKQDGTTDDQDRKIVVKDVAELLWDSVGKDI